jgi:hypothetical protein
MRRASLAFALVLHRGLADAASASHVHVSRKVVESYREHRSELFRNVFSGRRRAKVEEPPSPNGAPIEIVKTWSDFYDELVKEHPQLPGESDAAYDKRNAAVWEEWCQTLTSDEQSAIDREIKLAKKRKRYQAIHGAPGEGVSLSSLYAGAWSAPTVTEIEMTKEETRREKDRIKKSNKYYAPKKEDDPRPTPTRRRTLAPKFDTLNASRLVLPEPFPLNLVCLDATARQEVLWELLGKENVVRPELPEGVRSYANVTLPAMLTAGRVRGELARGRRSKG